ncbi:hypothetical protein [Kitasatospora sp. NPDC059571]|uniref:hypothetical protein n=1 Tax=Kitasatospora sp. NPDC059571 TaxID=3346871 RepID=UPI0036AC8AE7
MDRRLLRITGAATAVYGIAVACRPGLLARPSGLVAPDGSVPEEVATTLRPLALRDAACGLAMLAAPDDRSLRTAALLRIAADLGDAALLSATLPGRRHRAMALVVSAGWGALSVAGLCRSGPPGRPARQEVGISTVSTM